MSFWLRIAVVSTAASVMLSLARPGAQSQETARPVTQPPGATDFTAFPVQGNVSVLIGPAWLTAKLMRRFGVAY